MSEPPRLQRLTMRYDADEDRFGLSGADLDGAVHSIWLTRRLLCRILPPLFSWLDAGLQSTNAPVTPASEKTVHAFTQQAAVATRRPSPTISQPHDGPNWLVRGIGLKASAQGVLLTFSSGPRGTGNAVVLPLAAMALRQWLAILHGQWREAGWDMALWPDWVASAESLPATCSPAFH